MLEATESYKHSRLLWLLVLHTNVRLVRDWRWRTHKLVTLNYSRKRFYRTRRRGWSHFLFLLFDQTTFIYCFLWRMSERKKTVGKDATKTTKSKSY